MPHHRNGLHLHANDFCSADVAEDKPMLKIAYIYQSADMVFINI